MSEEKKEEDAAADALAESFAVKADTKETETTAETAETETKEEA